MTHNHHTTLAQIGKMNVLAISGGRVIQLDDVLALPVSHGYRVEVELDEGSDTYTVRRVFVRNGKRHIKGEQTNVYCDEIGEVAYRASCFRNGSEFAPFV